MAMHLWAVAEAADGRTPGASRSDTAGYAAGLTTWLIGASVLVVAHALAGEMPPWTLCCTRSLISALVLLPLVARHRREIIAFLRSHWREAALIGAMGLGLTQGVLFTALGLTSAVNVAIVLGLTPMITMVLARLMLGEPMNAWQALGSAVAFAGIVIICVQGSLARLRGFDIGFGDLLALGAACAFRRLYGAAEAGEVRSAADPAARDPLSVPGAWPRCPSRFSSTTTAPMTI